MPPTAGWAAATFSVSARHVTVQPGDPGLRQGDLSRRLGCRSDGDLVQLAHCRPRTRPRHRPTPGRECASHGRGATAHWLVPVGSTSERRRSAQASRPVTSPTCSATTARAITRSGPSAAPGSSADVAATRCLVQEAARLVDPSCRDRGPDPPDQPPRAGGRDAGVPPESAHRPDVATTHPWLRGPRRRRPPRRRRRLAGTARWR